jgi:hypothetical protein
MYEPYPTSTSGHTQEPVRAEPPRSVLNAVKLMYAGAALSAIVVIVAIATTGSLKASILSKYPNYTSAQVHQAEVGYIAIEAIGGLIAIGLWLWMAWANRGGRSWARIVSAVLFGISTLNLLGSFLRVHAVGTIVAAVVVWLVGFGAIMLLFNRESNPYFQKQPPLL